MVSSSGSRARVRRTEGSGARPSSCAQRCASLAPHYSRRNRGRISGQRETICPPVGPTAAAAAAVAGGNAASEREEHPRSYSRGIIIEAELPRTGRPEADPVSRHVLVHLCAPGCARNTSRVLRTRSVSRPRRARTGSSFDCVSAQFRKATFSRKSPPGIDIAILLQSILYRVLLFLSLSFTSHFTKLPDDP